MRSDGHHTTHINTIPLHPPRPSARSRHAVRATLKAAKPSQNLSILTRDGLRIHGALRSFRRIGPKTWELTLLVGEPPAPARTKTLFDSDIADAKRG